MQKSFSQQLPANCTQILVYDRYDGVIGAAIFETSIPDKPLLWLVPGGEPQRDRVGPDFLWLAIPPLKN